MFVHVRKIIYFQQQLVDVFTRPILTLYLTPVASVSCVLDMASLRKDLRRDLASDFSCS